MAIRKKKFRKFPTAKDIRLQMSRKCNLYLMKVEAQLGAQIQEVIDSGDRLFLQKRNGQREYIENIVDFSLDSYWCDDGCLHTTISLKQRRMCAPIEINMVFDGFKD